MKLIAAVNFYWFLDLIAEEMKEEMLTLDKFYWDRQQNKTKTLVSFKDIQIVEIKKFDFIRQATGEVEIHV